MSREQRSVAAELHDARSKTIYRAVDTSRRGAAREKREWEDRRKYIDRLLNEFALLDKPEAIGRTVFVSYSDKTGSPYFEMLKARLLKDKFEIHTGFDHPAQTDDGTILGRILTQLRRSSLYCGILTKEIEVREKDGVARWAPSVWTVEEKGMALALGKPFVLLVEDGVHEAFWIKTTPHKVHEVFRSDNFHDKLEHAVEALLARYNEIAMQYLETGEHF